MGAVMGLALGFPSAAPDVKSLPKRGGREGGSVGGGKAIAGPYSQGYSSVPTTPPSLPSLPALGHRSLGAYGCLTGPLTGGTACPSMLHAWLDIG